MSGPTELDKIHSMFINIFAIKKKVGNEILGTMCQQNYNKDF